MMKAEIFYDLRRFEVDFSKPHCLSLAIHRENSNPNAYFLPAPEFEPFRVPGFVGSVAEGGPCNCEVLRLAPHGNGTHTECVGHISSEPYYIVDCLKDTHTVARLATVHPQPSDNGDSVIRASDVAAALAGFRGQSLVLRSASVSDPASHQWSGTNPPYCEEGVGILLRNAGILHFLLDVPSVDRESDGGKLCVHHEFWNYPDAPRLNATITELIRVPEELVDGVYLLSIGVPQLKSDAAPSHCCLFSMNEVLS